MIFKEQFGINLIVSEWELVDKCWLKIINKPSIMEINGSKQIKSKYQLQTRCFAIRPSSQPWPGWFS